MLQKVPFGLCYVFVIAFTVGACSSLITPRIDERTGTTLAQRCVDYRAALLAYQQTSEQRELSEAETAAQTLLSTWVIANCPAVPELKPTQVGDFGGLSVASAQEAMDRASEPLFD
jgi:hypothetical protein